MSEGRGDDGDCTSTLSSPALARKEKSAVLERGYRRQRSVGETRPRTLCRACFEPELLSQSQHFGDADGGAAEAMANLLRVGADAVKAQQRHQNDQSGIGWVQICGLCQHVGPTVTISSARVGQTLQLCHCVGCDSDHKVSHL
jgi:hypothetical protein